MSNKSEIRCVWVFILLVFFAAWLITLMIASAGGVVCCSIIAPFLATVEVNKPCVFHLQEKR